MTEVKKKEYLSPPPEAIAGSGIEPAGWYTKYRDPTRFMNIQQLRELFTEIKQHKSVSDIVLKSDEPVCIKTKRFGLKAITHRCLSHAEVEVFAKELSNNDAIMQRISAGDTISDLGNILNDDSFDEATGLQGEKNRYRFEITGCASTKTEKGVSIILRPLPDAPLDYRDLGLPLDFVNNFIVKDGIVIVAGATGEGKSTTLASVIRYILEHDTIIKGIILTHEDPIEVSFSTIKSKHSVVIQSQVGQGDHINSYSLANRSAMRRSPDLVFLGELRDEGTIEAAVELSLTGHPVFATTHASTISAIFPRLISRFPKEVQSQKTFDLIDTTRFLVAQKLIWNTSGKLMAVRETLVFSEALRAYLKRFSDNNELLYAKINKIMDEELLGASNYLRQADRLLAAGEIDEVNYRYLVGTQGELDDEALQILEEV